MKTQKAPGFIESKRKEGREKEEGEKEGIKRETKEEIGGK